MYVCKVKVFVSVVSNSATPWKVAHSPGKNTGVGCHFLLQGIFLTQELNLGLLHGRQVLYHLSYQGSPLYCAGRSVNDTCICFYLMQVRD